MNAINAKKPITAIGESGSTSRTTAASKPDRAESRRSTEPMPDPKAWAPPHRQAQADHADRSDGEPGHEEHVEDPLVALPHGREHRALGLGSARSLIEVRNPDGRGMRERAGGKHRQAKDAEHARITRMAGARVTKRAIEHEQRRDPEDEDGEVEAVLDRPSGADGRKATDRRIRTNDQAHEDEHEDEEEGASRAASPPHRYC